MLLRSCVHNFALWRRNDPNIIKEIQMVSSKSSQKSAGELDPFDFDLLYTVAPMFKHVVPVALASEGDFFHVQANFVSACKRDGLALPSKGQFHLLCGYCHRSILGIQWLFSRKVDGLQQVVVFLKLFASVLNPINCRQSRD